MADADRIQLREELLQVRDYLHREKTLIREGLVQWGNQIDQFEDEDVREEKSDAFLQFRQEGTDANQEDVDVLVDDAEERILNIDRKINRITNPVELPRPPIPRVDLHEPQQVPVVPPNDNFVGPLVLDNQEPDMPQQAEADGDANSNPANEAEPIPSVDCDGDLLRPVPAVIPFVQAQCKSRYKKVELRKFRGDPAEFPGWMNSFMFNVNSEGGIPGEMKLDQLLAAVEGAPKEAIQGLSYTAGSFQIAVDILTERFGQMHLIVESLQNQLMGLQLTSSRATDLRIFFDRLNMLLRQLGDVDKDSSQCGMTCQLIIGKLPSHVYDELLKMNFDQPWTTQALVEKLSKYVSHQETVARRKDSTNAISISEDAET
ncbi:MAG: DUF1759 domain-containing protein [Gammaproteobacteria bacterium]|nr:DUF1759 domain-containing protein [Gammaproteobacteria bacterium]